MLKSLVEDALARDDAPMPRFEQAPAAQPAYKQAEDADAELIAILQTLRTNIKIIGVGGGGSNTINRIYDEQIVGAETYAANTDAQHLLMVRAQHKILLGRRSTPDWAPGRCRRQESRRPKRPNRRSARRFRMRTLSS